MRALSLREKSRELQVGSDDASLAVAKSANPSTMELAEADFAQAEWVFHLA
jgi:hypothetical protein